MLTLIVASIHATHVIYDFLHGIPNAHRLQQINQIQAFLQFRHTYSIMWQR